MDEKQFIEPSKEAEKNNTKLPETKLPESGRDDRFRLGRREIGLIILILAALAAAGLFAWRVNERKAEQARSITNFDECVAAGNPVMESYPEQCAAGGKTFVNSKQEVVNDWIKTTSGKGGFTVIFPEGWSVDRDINSDTLIARGFPELGSVKPAKIADVDGFGFDGPATLTIILTDDVPADDPDAEPKGRAIEYVLDNKNQGDSIKGKKYTYEYTEDTEQGYPDSRLKGEMSYLYVFKTPNKKKLLVSYEFLLENPANIIRQVDYIVNSIQIN